MKITDIITGARPCLSFEVFPPKTDDKFAAVSSATHEIAALHPGFMSVTYGAGGGTSEFTANIAQDIQEKYGVTTIAHLTCVSSTKQQIRDRLSDLRARGIENILALRGDMPADLDKSKMEYAHASELIGEIRAFGGFTIGGACYPEGHPESVNCREDVAFLREKVDAGCEFLTTQMFFDNNILYNFVYRIREAGINVPVIAGIMPVTAPAQIKRICSISGTALPQRFVRIVDRFGDDPAAMLQAGVAYATEQVIDLIANGINAVHIYSMNKPKVAEMIKANLSSIL